jgi:hypothetical protein
MPVVGSASELVDRRRTRSTSDGEAEEEAASVDPCRAEERNRPTQIRGLLQGPANDGRREDLGAHPN